MNASTSWRPSLALTMVFLAGCTAGKGSLPSDEFVVSGLGTLNLTTFGWDDPHDKILVLEVGNRLSLWSNVSINHDDENGVRFAFGPGIDAGSGLEVPPNQGARPAHFGASETIRASQVISLCHAGQGASNVTVKITDTSDGPRPNYSGATSWIFEEVSPCVGAPGGN